MLLSTWCPVDRGRTAGGRRAGRDFNTTPKGSLLQRDAVEYWVLRWKRMQLSAGCCVECVAQVQLDKHFLPAASEARETLSRHVDRGLAAVGRATPTCKGARRCRAASETWLQRHFATRRRAVSPTATAGGRAAGGSGF